MIRIWHCRLDDGSFNLIFLFLPILITIAAIRTHCAHDVFVLNKNSKDDIDIFRREKKILLLKEDNFYDTLVNITFYDYKKRYLS